MNTKAWQHQLVQAYPHLFMRSLRGTPFALGYPSCPDGWREIVVRVVMRVSEAAKGYPARFCEISEHHGSLRIYWKAESTLPKWAERCIEDAIALAEARSACTCVTCGALGRLFSASDGRLLPLCSKHAQGEPINVRPGMENVYIVREVTRKQAETIACRKYDWRLDRFVEFGS